MPLVRKQQLLTITETTPNLEVPAGNFAGTDAVDVLDVSWQQERALNERQPARSTLSPTLEGVGRGSAGISATADIKGSGTALTTPDYSRLLEACGLLLTDAKTLTMSVALSKVIRPGDLLTDITSGGTAIALANAAVGQTTLPVYLKSGQLTAGNGMTSEFTGSMSGTVVSTVNTAAASVGRVWVPTSIRALVITTTGAWSSGGPAVGEMFTSTTTLGVIEGAFLVISVVSTSTEAILVWGRVSASSALASASGKTATAAGGTPTVQSRTKSQTMLLNRDGLNRSLVGALATVTFQGEAGNQGKMRFEFKGKAGTVSDSSPLTGTSFPTTSPPRLQGGHLLLDGKAFPHKSVEIGLGNNVVMHSDANSSEGDVGAEIVSRDPRATIEVDQVGKLSFDFWSKWSAGTTAVLSSQYGSTTGNRISVIARKAQLSEFADGDQDGIATHRPVFKLRSESSDGDDEILIAHT